MNDKTEIDVVVDEEREPEPIAASEVPPQIV